VESKHPKQQGLLRRLNKIPEFVGSISPLERVISQRLLFSFWFSERYFLVSLTPSEVPESDFPKLFVSFLKRFRPKASKVGSWGKAQNVGKYVDTHMGKLWIYDIMIYIYTHGILEDHVL
jgi:hypothetical protein